MFETKLKWDLSGQWLRNWCNAPEMRQFGMTCDNGSLLKFSPQFGSGVIDHTVLQKDALSVMLIDCTLKSDIKLNIASHSQLYGFYFDFSEGPAIACLAPFFKSRDHHYVSYGCLSPQRGSLLQIAKRIHIQGINILIQKDFFQETIRNCDKLKMLATDKFEGYTTINKKMFRIFKEATDYNRGIELNSFDNVFLKANIYQLLHLFLSHIICERQLNDPQITDPEKKIVILDRIIQEERLDDLPSIDDAAKEVALCPSRFKELFKKIFDKSYYRYYKELRLNRAKKMLQHPQIEIEDIAATFGYHTTASFVKAFSLEYGLTPQQFREKQLL
ncbi:helix-turn-helix domain-containing protein [Taibaiella soli]|nr:AraC family transcriptional regulator [Taibaiella soli]